MSEGAPWFAFVICLLSSCPEVVGSSGGTDRIPRGGGQACLADHRLPGILHRPEWKGVR